METNNPTQHAWFLRNRKRKHFQFFIFMFLNCQKYLKLNESEKYTVVLSHVNPRVSYSLAEVLAITLQGLLLFSGSVSTALQIS